MSSVSPDRRVLLQNAARALDVMQARLDSLERSRKQPVAVIGIGCRFPGGENPSSFWRLLREGVDAVVETPCDRWDPDVYYDPDPQAPGKMYTRSGGFLNRVDGFDPAFFNIAPREAVSMDPQQRLLLEVAWEAIEEAGYSTDSLANTRTGVFAGICTSDYAQLVSRGGAGVIDAYSGTGNAFSVVAGRISYVLGLQGPSLAIDTACSSSLVALNLAIDNLRSGQCDMALAGGVNLLLAPESTVYFCKVRALSPTGRCRTFDAAADGYVRGEGCGVVVLKRLDDALRDGDRIQAVIRGSAVNHDGRSSGLTVPNALAQEAVIGAALRDAGVGAQEIGYVEAHGTGTPLGDPIEIRALSKALGRNGKTPVVVGSVKTNVGHLEAAAGVAGLIKVVLALQHRQLPAHLHWNQPNPHIDWEHAGVRVALECENWEAIGGKRIAGISSFGFGGTNAHAIVEEAPQAASREVPEMERPLHVIAVSGRTEAAARELAERYACAFAAAKTEIADMAYTANAGRNHWEYRLAVTGASGEELAERLREAVPRAMDRGEEHRIAFLFTGQGSQYADMGRELYETEPGFRRTLQQCGDILRGHMDRPLLEVLYGGGSGREAEREEELKQTAYAQPALFALEYALAELWRNWGVAPAVVMGHSVGEYVAATVAGVFDLEAALRLIAARGRLMQALPEAGAMAAVFAGPSRVRETLAAYRGRLSVAAVNGPGETVIAGDRNALKAVLRELKQDGIRVRELAVSHAFHSPLMEPMMEAFAEVAAEVKYGLPALAMVSNLTGEVIRDGSMSNAEYWTRHIREEVRFAEGMRRLGEDEGCTEFIEVGPKPVLLGMGRNCIGERGQGWLPSLRPGISCWRQMLDSAGELYTRGAAIDWQAFDRPYARRRVSMPTYPFQRQRYWIEESIPAIAATLEIPRAAPESTTGKILKKLRGATETDREEILIAELQVQVAQVLKSREVPSPDTGFAQMGMDSLMAVELRNRLESSIGKQLPATLAFNYPTIRGISRYLLQDVLELAAKDVLVATEAGPSSSEPIAVVGLACRFPGGADDPRAFWQLLYEGRDAVGTMPSGSGRWNAERFYDAEPATPGKSYVREAAWLRVAVDEFDARFFSISPREAAGMDPQQRLLLELCWEALEDAAVAPDRLRDTRTGVFVGINTNDYARVARHGNPLDAYLFTGNTFSVAAGRISHFFGLHGPSVAIDTACSSSLVATHLACQSLRLGECNLALAAGVNLMLSPDGNVVLCQMRALAPDGRSKSFDALADGYGRGEGGGVVVLKRLSDALRDGNRVLSIVRGSAVNHDGPSSGLTVPNGPAQQSLMREALRNAGIGPAEVSYLEAHGTGTALGDPIELDAAEQVYGKGRDLSDPLLLGSVKTNIGHLEAAAGVAGLIKVVLSLQHGEIPEHLHFRAPSPHFAWERAPLRVVTGRQPWPARGFPRIAGLSSFGMSGTNAHVVVEEPPVAGVREAERRPCHILALSARNEEALGELVSRYQAVLQNGANSADIGDICFTANVGRSHFAHRVAVAGRSLSELLEGLNSRAIAGIAANRPKVAFLFTGQGSQYPGMGRELYETQPVFRKVIDECEEHLRDILAVPLREAIYGSQTDLLNQTAYTQPALFAVEYGLAELWRSWGIQPAAVMGHSVGEYVAAAVAGVFSMAEGVRLLAERGRLMQALPEGGAMAAVLGPQERVNRAVSDSGGRLSVAAWNGPGNGVISGDLEEVERVEREMKSEGIAVQRLHVSHAFHSARMEPAMEAFRESLSKVERRTPQIRWVANLTGELRSEAPDAEYWVRQMREPVQFEKSMRTLRDQGCDVLVEAGPAPVLIGMVQRCRVEPEKTPQEQTAWLPSLRKGMGDWRQMLASLSELYVRGCTVDWEGFDRPYLDIRRSIALPTYPFQRKRFWVETAETTEPERPKPEAHWLYRTEWRLTERTAPVETLVPRGRWLVLADNSGFGLQFARELEQSGDSCALVYPDDAHFTRDGMGEIVRRHANCQGVIHLWSLDRLQDPGLTQPRDCGSVLHLLQGLVDNAGTEMPRLWIVTPNVQSIPGYACDPGAATLWGLGRVIALEHPELWGGLIDIDLSSDSVTKLAAEIRRPDGEDQIGFREGRRFVPRLTRAPDLPVSPNSVPRADATYLITGGVGSLGLALAQWLIDAGARHLVLTGRRAPSEASAWKLESLRRSGASIGFVLCNVANTAEVAALIDGLDAAAPLAGVFHAAGILDDGILINQDWQRFAAVMAPKVQGAWNLHLATAQINLDFFAMFSSAAAVLGSPGQANYAAGNAFMDALASYRTSLGLKSLSVDWGPWAELGMAANLARQSSRQWRPRGIEPIEPEQGFRTMWQLLTSEDSQVMAMPVDWNEFCKQFPAGYKARILSELVTLRPETKAEKSAIRLGLEAAPVSLRLDLLVDVIQDAIARSLGVDRSEVPASATPGDQRFFELGLDSLMAVELRNDLVSQLGIPLPATLLFQHPTTLALAAHLVSMPDFSGTPIPPAIEDHSDELEGVPEDELIALLAQELAST